LGLLALILGIEDHAIRHKIRLAEDVFSRFALLRAVIVAQRKWSTRCI